MTLRIGNITRHCLIAFLITIAACQAPNTCTGTSLIHCSLVHTGKQHSRLLPHPVDYVDHKEESHLYKYTHGGCLTNMVPQTAACGRCTSEHSPTALSDNLPSFTYVLRKKGFALWLATQSANCRTSNLNQVFLSSNLRHPPLRLATYTLPAFSKSRRTSL